VNAILDYHCPVDVKNRARAISDMLNWPVVSPWK